MAMENPHFTQEIHLPISNGPFPIAMLVYQSVITVLGKGKSSDPNLQFFRFPSVSFQGEYQPMDIHTASGWTPGSPRESFSGNSRKSRNSKASF